MWPDKVSNPGPLTYESGVLPIALRGPAIFCAKVGNIWQGWYKQTTPRAPKLNEN